MNFPLEIPDSLRRQLPPGTGVLLGISGGVDSAVTLAMLKALECEVQCVTFKNFCYSEGDDDSSEKSCCSLEAIDDARRLAYSFDSPHWVGDVEKPFRQQVIDPFIKDYVKATTPNPCLACNADVRFPELVRLAERQGCGFAATGHYARIETAGNDAQLLCGVDPGKDQSYFLHRIEPRLFPRLSFPLGWYNKTQVRWAAAELGLQVAKKRDSQELCFVPDGDRGFLFSDQAGTPATQAGNIINRQGEVLGRHRGLIHYTVGQRKGLGVAAAEPLYVLELDLKRSALIVGVKADVWRDDIVAENFQTAVADFPSEWSREVSGPTDPDDNVILRIRHGHAGARVLSWQMRNDRIQVKLADEVDAPAPGQACVIYRGDVVLGGGRMMKRGAKLEGNRD
jgi:tRNA-specific 2-thiouridylase